MKSETRLNDRVFAIWCIVLVSLSFLALPEANKPAAIIAAFILPLSPFRMKSAFRLILLVVGLLSILIGPQLLLLGVPLALAVTKCDRAAVVSLALLTSTTFLYPYAQSIPIDTFINIPLPSFTFLVLASWVPAIIFLRTISLRFCIALMILPLISVWFLALGAEIWIGVDEFTNPLARLALSIFPSMLVGYHAVVRTSDEQQKFRTVIVPSVIGMTIVALVPAVPIDEIVFDEAHGKWETVLSSYGPEDFGRSANYTYSQLFEKSSRLVGSSSVLESENASLPNLNALLVVKMPTEPITEQFSIRLDAWVKRGGRLLVIADHTDLYDTTQNINSLINRFDILVSADATFDNLGMPNIPTSPLAAGILGRLDGNGLPFAWQTGSSFQTFPLAGLELLTYGASFAEPGDYSRPNRFGYFVPSLKQPYFNHSASIAVAHGKGAIAVILDSTPWSNFSIFKDQYNRMLRGVIHALEQPKHLLLVGSGALLLCLSAFIATIAPPKVVLPIIGLLLGLVFSAGISIGSVSWSKNLMDRDFGLRVVEGPTTRLEFLNQILLPGERNYSRIVSAMGKYGLMPIASEPGSEVPELTESDKWLLIEPTVQQLPAYEDLFKHLQLGRELTILFAPEQATSPDLLAWLREWGLLTTRSIGLSVTDGIKGGSGTFLGGRGPIIGREVRVITKQKSTSILNSYENDQFLQTYTLRPTELPRTSGFLSIGFSSDQFTDDAIGDVWEGIYPSSIGRQRERYLGAILTGDDRPSLMPLDLVRPQRLPIDLSKYIVLENGTLRVSGEFDSSNSEDPTTAYFHALRDQAAFFVAAHCPSLEEATQCSSRMLGEDMIEWRVSWKSPDGETVAAIELLHERRMSGLGSTWNVLFGN